MKKRVWRINIALFCCLGYFLVTGIVYSANAQEKIDLAGEWAFQIDSLDVGIAQQWFSRQLDDKIKLPGSTTSNGKGSPVSLQTPWTGSIFDSAYFSSPVYAPYRQPGNIKVPFWLQPVTYYKGAAWYQKTVTIPASWKGKKIELFIERSHWETSLWVDNKPIGRQNSLGTPHVFDLTKALTPGVHQVTVQIDNRIKNVNVGPNSHSVSDHTQTNWNGMVGKLLLISRPAVSLQNVQLYPDLKNKQLIVRTVIHNHTGKASKATLHLQATSAQAQAEKLKPLTNEVTIKGDSAALELVYPMGENPLLWDEFNPALYTLNVQLTTGKGDPDTKVISFGMREFMAQGTQFTINGRLTFLRGTLECAIFPKTGYPPTDVATWASIFEQCKTYGLNHMRFHSWCPPEAAFEAADQAGFYLQVESSSWANIGSSIGDGKPLDRYIYDESERMVQAYGNHPSFCMLTYGNEPGGDHHVEYLTAYVNYWKKKDARRLYTTAAGWPVIPESDYNSTSDPRIQAWGAGLKSIINSQRPSSHYDWSKIIAKWKQPTVSHEIGQWCVYPDFKEIPQYDGVLQAKNFEIFQETLTRHGMAPLADSFLLASGKLQVLCYKADIEAALRTPGFGGFQLLDLHDFPGQGTALVGVLSPFWKEKGYVSGKEYSAFCNTTVPLARFPKFVYLTNEQLSVPVEVTHFGSAALRDVTPSWVIRNAAGKTVFQGQFSKTTVPIGSCFALGEIKQSLRTLTEPGQLKLTVSVENYQNTWDLFVYPASLPAVAKGVVVTQQLDAKALQTLQNGGKVLLTLKKGAVKPEKGGHVQIGFSSIFWNTAWTNGQPPSTLGILCNPKHPALQAFPTEYHSNWQWWDAMSHSNAIRLDAVSPDVKPIVRVIDDWVTAQPLGLVFECKVGKGQLIVSGIDLLSDQENRPEARQLLHSLTTYMAGPAFHPTVQVAVEQIKGLLK